MWEIFFLVLRMSRISDREKISTQRMKNMQTVRKLISWKGFYGKILFILRFFWKVIFHIFSKFLIENVSILNTLKEYNCKENANQRFAFPQRFFLTFQILRIPLNVPSTPSKVLSTKHVDNLQIDRKMQNIDCSIRMFLRTRAFCPQNCFNIFWIFQATDQKDINISRPNCKKNASSVSNHERSF